MGRLYRFLVPPGSRRDRCAWIGLVTVRKLKEGPGPWFRAVRKGLFQLLPLGLRNRILRWSGEEQFFRRHELRAGAPDGGLERPGLVSVVLPVFNQADLLAASIDSVLAQSYAPFELIVLDDGSRDDARAVMQRYRHDPRVRLLTQPNQGLPKALSSGFEFACGEFFTWTSADNLMHPEQLSRLVACLRQRPEVSMVWGDYELIDDRGEPLRGGEFRVMDRTDPRNLAVVRTKRSTEDLNRYEDNYIGPCFLYRGRVGRLLGDYNPELGLEDYDYWMRINRLFRLEHLGTDDVLYRYRVHDNTLSARARELKILERAKVLMEYERRRAAWVAAPLRVLADEASRQWLAACVQAPDRLEALPDGELPTAVGEQKTLVVVDAATLVARDWQSLPANVALAVTFATVDSVHAARVPLQLRTELPLVAFAVDAAVAARLGVYRREVYVEASGPGAYGLAVRYAANATFFRATRDASKLARAVPVPIAEPLPAVLLQLDHCGRGGLERVVLDLAAELLARGHRVGLLAVDGSVGAAEFAAEHAQLERVTLPRRDEAAYRALLQGGWQVVDAHASTFGAEVAASVGVPFVQNVHNSYVWYERAEVERLRAADAHTAAYVCVSAQALGYLDLRLQLEVGKALVLENGIDAAGVAALAPERRRALRAEFGCGDDEFVFVQVASVQPAKAHRVAVQALAALRQHAPRARLLCVGDLMHPPLAAQLRGDIERLGQRDAVVLAGHRRDVAACYAAADAFVLPSYWEGCSLAVWEAIAAGLPLVLADTGAAAEQLRHGHGQLVAPPYGSLFDLDAGNLAAVVESVDAAYVQRTAAAMANVMRLPRRPTGSLPTMAQRATMAARKARLFAWLLQGGRVEAARTMLARAGR
ncbi:MAG: glycosyltransferase [Planctomycetes bacterium]|jgi:glycosyltransferase involved in cell wall biosynthesis|nr:glycosyltransferase [Planctomycetota bacterium]